MDQKFKKDIDELKMQMEKNAFKRWNERKEFRENPERYLEKKTAEKMKLETRYRNYNIREAMRPFDGIRNIEIKTVERRIGDSIDLSLRPPSQDAYKFGTPVGRIYQIPSPGIEIDAFGTGFLISNNLMITNHHVLPYKSAAEVCAINFKHEYNEYNKLLSGIHFKLNPGIFYLSDEKLDFAIVYVETMDNTGNDRLSDLGCIPLIATKGKIILKDAINIVQYPNGGAKQYATENNFVEDILEEDGFIQYTTDTDGASSGAPAANKHWEVVALHHCGIAMAVNGVVWSRFQKAWDPDTMTDDDKVYVANEGVSISRIIEFLKKQQFADARSTGLINAVLNNSVDKILEQGSVPEKLISIINDPKHLNGNGMNNNSMSNNGMSNNVFNFFNTANVNINAAQIAEPVRQLPDEKKDGTHIAIPEKKLRFDESYANRRYKGYKPNFLGIKIPLPQVADNRIDEIYKKEGADEPLLLKYYHYSLVMNEKFRMQMWSAVNVDYDPALKSTRERKAFGDESNSWRPDPRIPISIQITDAEFYKPATQVDRGHIVRRDDSCYGNTEMEIEFANSDTFHLPNCTPQHEGFNQSKQYGLWGLLENAIKDGLLGDDTKASIFAGPILVADEDRVYNGIYYPTRFWKVVIALDEEEGLIAYGFILDQSKVIDRRGMEAKFDFTQFKSQQRHLSKIEEEAGVIFPDIVKQADIFVKSGLEVSHVRNLESKSDLLIKPGNLVLI